MFIFSELIEETGRLPVLIFGMCGYFWTGLDMFEFWKIFPYLKELLRRCHIFESVKNHINAYVSHPIRDKIMKT